MHKGGRSLMAMNDVYLFTDTNGAKQSQMIDKRRVGYVVHQGSYWQVVDFKTVCHIAHSRASSCKLRAVSTRSWNCMGKYNNLVATT